MFYSVISDSIKCQAPISVEKVELLYIEFELSVLEIWNIVVNIAPKAVAGICVLTIKWLSRQVSPLEDWPYAANQQKNKNKK